MDIINTLYYKRLCVKKHKTVSLVSLCILFSFIMTIKKHVSIRTPYAGFANKQEPQMIFFFFNCLPGYTYKNRGNLPCKFCDIELNYSFNIISISIQF